MSVTHSLTHSQLRVSEWGERSDKAGWLAALGLCLPTKHNAFPINRLRKCGLAGWLRMNGSGVPFRLSLLLLFGREMWTNRPLLVLLTQKGYSNGLVFLVRYSTPILDWVSGCTGRSSHSHSIRPDMPASSIHPTNPNQMQGFVFNFLI